MIATRHLGMTEHQFMMKTPNAIATLANELLFMEQERLSFLGSWVARWNAPLVNAENEWPEHPRRKTDIKKGPDTNDAGLAMLNGLRI